MHEHRILTNYGPAILNHVSESKLSLNEQREGNWSRGNFRGWGRGHVDYQPRNQTNEKFLGHEKGPNRGRKSFKEHGKTKSIQFYNCQKYGHCASDC